jgi:fermentation-respiration switch protein FrsA (DUF1100 family)
MAVDVEFESGGQRCRGWLLSPRNSVGEMPAPCIVMAHGLGGTRDARLLPYAERFAQAGFAVLVFDYRHFGASDGEPRQLVSIPGQLADWRAAVAFARNCDGIDAGRIGLWGTSFSGGHVVVVAAGDEAIRCVTAQCPMMDGKAASRYGLRSGGLRQNLKLSAVALGDFVGSYLGMQPRRIAIAGKPGELAALATPDAWDGYMALVPEGFCNEICARIALQVPSYRPVTYASKVKCPVLIQICEQDSVAPPAAAEEMASALGALAEVERYPIGHFDVYVGDAFERSVRDQTRFFETHLKARDGFGKN